MARKWLEGAAGLRQETLTQPFTKCTGNRADELISASLKFYKKSALRKKRKALWYASQTRSRFKRRPLANDVWLLIPERSFYNTC